MITKHCLRFAFNLCPKTSERQYQKLEGYAKCNWLTAMKY